MHTCQNWTPHEPGAKQNPAAGRSLQPGSQESSCADGRAVGVGGVGYPDQELHNGLGLDWLSGGFALYVRGLWCYASLQVVSFFFSFMRFPILSFVCSFAVVLMIWGALVWT